jgi:hypothetical protein
MTLAEIKNRVMFQTNNDEEDVGDYLPHLVDYINDGYDRLVMIWAKSHCGTEDWPWLREYETQEAETDPPVDVPRTPEWTHKYLADWATWLVYRNGNPQKQQRGMAFRNSFEEMLAKVAGQGGMDGLNEDGTQKQYKKFINIPR